MSTSTQTSCPYCDHLMEVIKQDGSELHCECCGCHCSIRNGEMRELPKLNLSRSMPR